MSPPAEFSILYDLRDPAAWQQAHRPRGFWGKRFTEIDAVDNDHVLLVFRPAPDRRWRAWEEVRRRWIFEDLGYAA